MQVDSPKQIDEERARIEALDSSLDAQRTPYLKSQLRLALGHLDDAGDALRFAARPHADVARWNSFAALNIQFAVQTREAVQKLVDKYGGPNNVTEAGG